MRLTCPVCGARDRREFYYMGDAVALQRPSPEASDEVWDDYLHNRANPAGETRDLWQHEAGCGAWLVVRRNTITHEIYDVTLACDAKQALQEEAEA
ncbi:sarcosine oxidase subunit delta [Shimia sp. R9_3]|uniref:sarcosine oxidase subunit delta n=1 Tax=Shimia sp. R9_3 TaxID=2821113 RepID=UPI001ADA2703|nr:sarcosine oxidase subunit delta [Shimia sp. R9_3]MBO9400647.1 sarcosine oxidase subunit delta [Shimia sp. R9_3]